MSTLNLSPLCPQAPTLFAQIRTTIGSHVNIFRVNPARIICHSKATSDGFVLQVDIDINGETITAYHRRHHEMMPVTMAECAVRQRLDYVLPRLVKRFQCNVQHHHASITDR